MATRYRLPEALGGGECTIVERDPALTLMGKRAVVVSLGGGDVHAVVEHASLTEIEWPWEVVTSYGATVGAQPLGTGSVNIWVKPFDSKDVAVATIRLNIARDLAGALFRAADAAEKEQS